MKLHSLALFFAATLTLSACGGGGGGTSNNGSTNPTPATPEAPPKSSSSSAPKSLSSASSISAQQSSLSSNSSAVAIPEAPPKSSSSSIAASLSSASPTSAPQPQSSSTASSLPSSSSSSSAVSSSKSAVSSSSTSSSSSSSSSSTSSGCASVAGQLFIDCADPAWILGAFEQKKDYSTQAVIYDGTQGQLVTWQIVPSNEAGRGNIIDVQFKDNSSYNGKILFDVNSTPVSRDMSAFATGKLVFDVKVISTGTFQSALEVILDCGYPCTSHEHVITIPVLNQWTRIEIPSSELLNDGFKFNKASNGFTISPAWNKQNGAKFQLDNIHWVKGPGAVPTPPVNCYEQPFETWGIGFRTDVINGAASLDAGAVRQIIARSDITPNWSSTNDILGYVPAADNTFSPCAFTNGFLSAQIRLPVEYIFDGSLKVGLYYEDRLKHRAFFPGVTASSFKPNTYKTVSVPLLDANNAPAFTRAESGFNVSDVVNVGFYMDANGKSPSIKGLINIDNINISGKPVTPNSGVTSSANSCQPATQNYNGTSAVGFGFSTNSTAYVSLKLNNASFTNNNAALTSSKYSTMLVYSQNDIQIYAVDTGNLGLPSNEQLASNFNYAVTNPNQASSLSIRVFSTASDAVNATNMLSLTTAALPAAVCSGGSPSPVSSSKSSVSSVSVVSSSSSSAISSSKTSSAISSSSSSSSSSSALSLASSSASSLCAQTAQTANNTAPLGFGVASGNTVYVAVTLSNATFNPQSVSLSATGMSSGLLFNSGTKAVLSLAANANSPQTTQLQFGFSYVTTNPSNSVSVNYGVYTTAADALNSVSMLSGSSSTLNANSCNAN